MSEAISVFLELSPLFNTGNYFLSYGTLLKMGPCMKSMLRLWATLTNLDHP